MAAENREFWRKVDDMEEKASNAVSSARQLQRKNSAMAEGRDVLAVECKKPALDIKFMYGLIKEAMSLRTCVAEIEGASMIKLSKARTKHRTADMEAVFKKERTERSLYKKRIACLKGNLHEVRVKLDFAEHCNNGADSRYSMLSNKCDLVKHQSSGGGVYSEEMEQQIANLSKAVDSSIKDLSRHAAHAQNVV